MTTLNQQSLQELNDLQGQMRVVHFLVTSLANYQGIDVNALKKKLGNKATDADLTRELLLQLEREAQAEFIKRLASNPQG